MDEQTPSTQLTEKERRILAWCEQKYFSLGRLPTAEEVSEKFFNGNFPSAGKFLKSEVIQKAFENRGMPTVVAHDLTPEQVRIANDLVNPMDHRSERKILADAKISSIKFAGWKQQSAFQEYLRLRSETLLSQALPDAHMALVDNVRRGDLSSLKFYYEITGRYINNQTNVDIPLLLTRVFEIIARHVTDQEQLLNIAKALEGLDSPGTVKVVRGEIEGISQKGF